MRAARLAREVHPNGKTTMPWNGVFARRTAAYAIQRASSARKVNVGCRQMRWSPAAREVTEGGARNAVPRATAAQAANHEGRW